jgi:hypothetical protein
MRIKDERRQTQRERRDPKIDHMRNPQRDRHIQQHNQRAHAQVDARTRKAREERAKVRARRREPTAGRDVPRTAVVEIADDGVALDLGGEDLEDGGEGAELFRETEDGADCTAFDEFCKKADEYFESR